MTWYFGNILIWNFPKLIRLEGSVTQTQHDFDTLVRFFKVLGNENRLMIVGLLATGELSVREIADMLDLKEPTVSEHLTMLRELDLVSFRQQGNHRYYAFNPEPLRLLNRDILSREALASLVADRQPPTQKRDAVSVISRYLKDGRLTQIPAQRRNLLIVLAWLADQFVIGESYPEKAVNAVLQTYHDDFATLRRELVNFHFMERANGLYWRTPESAPVLP